MVRVSRGIGAKALGPRPPLFAPSLRVECPNCGAKVGERCRSWKVDNGERLYIKSYRKAQHPERYAAAKEGAA